MRTGPHAQALLGLPARLPPVFLLRTLAQLQGLAKGSGRAICPQILLFGSLSYRTLVVIAASMVLLMPLMLLMFMMLARGKPVRMMALDP